MRRRTGGRRADEAADTELKTKTPHVNVGNKYLNVNPGLINPKQLFNWEGTI